MKLKEKWKKPIQGWKIIQSQILDLFGERYSKYLEIQKIWHIDNLKIKEVIQFYVCYTTSKEYIKKIYTLELTRPFYIFTLLQIPLRASLAPDPSSCKFVCQRT